MALDADLTGRSYDLKAPYDVSRVDIARFAAAVGEADPVHTDAAVARERGHRDVLAPVTFPIVVASGAMHQLLADPSVEIELRHLVHSAQRFESARAICAGDVLSARLTVESVRRAAGTSLIATRTEITDADGAHVCISHATLAHRSPDGTDG